MTRVIVSGSMANKPANGGNVWVRMSWVVGLRRLGVDALFVEQIAPEACVDEKGAPAEFARSVNREFFRQTAEWFGISDRAALVCTKSHETAGVAWSDLLEAAKSADLLLNLSGHLTLEELTTAVRRTAYVDDDPGFTQFWHADPQSRFRIPKHDLYYTIGENIGAADCLVPTSGIPWRVIRQPVVLDDWPITLAADRSRFTTVASWRGPYGPIEWQGKTFGVKCHEFRKVIELPERTKGTTKKQRAQRGEREKIETPAAAESRTEAESKIQNPQSKMTAPPPPQPSPGGRGSKRKAVLYSAMPCALSPIPSFELALAIHPADERDRQALVEHGWKLIDPQSVADDAEAFRRYVQQSAAEFSVAQGVYVDTNSGWFSDRTVRYLASGKPALVQETGFSRNLPSGEGLIAFRNLDEAVEGSRRIMSDYDGHCQAAREIAEKYFDSDKVLGRMLEQVRCQ